MKKQNIIIMLIIAGASLVTGYFSLSVLGSSKLFYLDKNYNFSIEYPGDYIIKQRKEGFVQFINDKYSNMEAAIPNIILRVRNTSPDTNLATWFDDNSRLYIGDLKWSDVPHSEPVALEVGGKQAVQTTYEGMGEVKSTVVKTGLYILELRAHTLTDFEKDSDLLGTYNDIIDSLNFN